MTRELCSNCNTVLVVANHSGDYVHNCNDFPNIPTLAQEDVPNIGAATDFDGTTPGEAGIAVNMRGRVNTLEGSKAWILGGKNTERTPRGNNPQTTRARTYFQHTDMIGDKR